MFSYQANALLHLHVPCIEQETSTPREPLTSKVPLRATRTRFFEALGGGGQAPRHTRETMEKVQDSGFADSIEGARLGSGCLDVQFPPVDATRDRGLHDLLSPSQLAVRNEGAWCRSSP
ncbi:unnamed protein product [Diplocarpon coronariae]